MQRLPRRAIRRIVVLVLALTPPGLPAQTPQSHFCMRSNPSKGCDWFPVTEIGMAWEQGQPSYADKVVGIGYYGLMHDVGTHYAIGGTLGVHNNTGGNNELTWTIGPRGRLWFGHSGISLDVAPQLIFSGAAERDSRVANRNNDTITFTLATAQPPGFMLDAALNLSDWASVFWRLDLQGYSHVVQFQDARGVDGNFQYTNYRTIPQSGVITTNYLGVRLGSYPGLVATGLVLLYGVLFALTYHGSN